MSHVQIVSSHISFTRIPAVAFWIVVALITTADIVVTHAAASEPRFDGEVAVKWVESDGPDREMMLLAPFSFVDESNVTWNVPRGAIVDGASIPKWLWTLVGSPYVGDYRRASVVHDYFCDVRTKPSDAVHLMFYEAAITGGVSVGGAKILYAGILIDGPRWKIITPAGALPGVKPIIIDDPKSFDGLNRDEFLKWIRDENPSVEEIRSRVEAHN